MLSVLRGIRVSRVAAVAIAAAVVTFGASLEAFQAPATATPSVSPPAMNLEAPPENQRIDLPQWAFTPSTSKHAPQPPDDGTLLHLPGSAKAYSRTQINNPYATPDWFPETHVPQPKPVSEGNKPKYPGCGECHLANGNGKPDTAALNHLPAAYIMQQIEDFRAGRRHGSVIHMTASEMIPIANGITPEETKEAAEYFAAIQPAKWIRVVETSEAPKVQFIGHRSVETIGADKEPIGNRIVELPENEDYTVMRDSQSGFIAYVPTGSLKKGEALVKTGGNGKTTACIMCHGPNLTGMGNVIPPIAGRSPSQLARALYDFKSGARNGTNATLMKAPVANLTDEDIVNITAYLASLPQ
jgi:cytochrome c553